MACPSFAPADDGVSNPYLKRRLAARAERIDQVRKPIPQIPPQAKIARPAYAEVAPPPPPANEPLRVTIPNIHARTDAPPPVAAVPPPPAEEPTLFSELGLDELLPEIDLSFDLPSTLFGPDDPEPAPPRAVAASQPEPVVIIRKEKLQPATLAQADPAQLQALTPAAGDNNPVPLIPLPDATSSTTTPPPAPPPAAAAAPPPPIPVTAAPAPAPADSAAPVVAPAATLPPLEEIIQNAAQMPAPAVSTPPPVQARTSEPPPELSQSSKNILNKIPSRLDTPKGGTAPIDIAHTREVQDLYGVQAGPLVHDSAGLSVEIKQRPTNWDYEIEKAYNALLSGHSSTAVDIYRNVLANDPNNKNALFGLAATYHRNGQIDLARPLYGRLLTLDPANRDALNNFLVLMADEAPEAAVAEMEKLEGRNPDFSPIPAQLAVIYQNLGQPDKAVEKMFRALALSPENVAYRYNLAIMLDKQQKFDEAARLYRQVVEAHHRGEVIPGNIQKIQERLTFISSNRL